ncbi:MAG: hypothetical protein ACJ747_02940 [Gaiellaceae bacterium]|jgi:hypothetical protein
MRKLILLLLVVVALAVPVGTQAAATVQTQPFDALVTICNGDVVHLTGQLAVVMTETTTPSGGVTSSIHFQPQGVTGVDLSTGTIFHATGLTRDIVVNTPPGGATETFVNRFHIQATGGAQSYVVSELFHVTVSPDGTTRVFFDNFSSTC